MTLHVVHFPNQAEHEADDAVQDRLRELADEVEANKHGDAHNVAWVIDCGDGIISLGIAGRTKSPGVDAHYLFALAQRQIETL